jgi:uncharacterized protein YjbI with pentapeptide repeats
MKNRDTGAQTRHITSWKERSVVVRCRWAVPFAFVEWFCEHLSDRLNKWAFLDVLERIGHLAVLVAVVFYIMEAPERRKVKQYYAWQIINSLKDSRTDGGRKYAIHDLIQDGVSLAGIELMYAILPHVDFKNADLRQGRFEGAELLDADFQRAVLSGSKFDESLLSRANFSEACMKNVEFGSARLENANFSHADLEKANFQGAKLKNAVFADSNLSGARLDRVDLTGVDFSRANLRRVELGGCVHWKDIKSIRLANITGVTEPEKGFLEWAREHGAVEIEDDLKWKHLIDQEGRNGAVR